MDKVGVKLMGGLGNYMFQIAAAFAYSRKHNKELVLNQQSAVVVQRPLNEYKQNIMSKLNLDQQILANGQVYQEPANFRFSEIPYTPGNLQLLGYFQSEKYFKEFRNEIINLFPLANVMSDELKNKITCSLHVRRGDYVKQPENHPTQNLNYYMKALKKMPEDCICLIFSDDISWCKENFPEMPEKFIFIEGKSDHEDMALMSQCTHNIICNSSFSWWAAWLNKNPDKIVIAPTRWFGPAISYDTTDIYCENWIKI